MEYHIRAYNSAGVLARVLDKVHSARYRLGENEVGDFDVTVPWGDGSIPELLSPPNGVEFWRGNTFVFGGVIRQQAIVQEGRVPFYTASGPSYMQWLADARHRPSTTGTADTVYASDALDDIMKAVVRAQVLDQNTRFQVPADSHQSARVEAYTATAYETVLETLQSIATRAEDTTFDIVRDSDKVLRFRTFTPSRGEDRSLGTASPVIFDMRGGNLIDARWERNGNAVVNALWGGGPGDKAARYIWPSGDALTDAQSILDWGRIEGFFDAGNEATIDVQKKTQEELAKLAKPEESVLFNLSQFGRYRLSEDFDFGTKVTVQWSPIMTFSDRIRGLEVRLEQNAILASVDINVGDTITGDTNTRAAIRLGKFLQRMRRTISVQTRH